MITKPMLPPAMFEDGSPNILLDLKRKYARESMRRVRARRKLMGEKLQKVKPRNLNLEEWVENQ